MCFLAISASIFWEKCPSLLPITVISIMIKNTLGKKGLISSSNSVYHEEKLGQERGRRN